MGAHVESLPPERRVYLTGHSVGGGIAAVVSALTGHQAVAISPPGVFRSFPKHASAHLARKGVRGPLPKKDFLHESLVLVNEGDWVANAFDSQAGMVQKVGCDRSLAGDRLHLACHMLEGTICHLLHHCGDHRHRWHKCNYTYDADLQRERSRASWHHARQRSNGVLHGLFLDVAEQITDIVGVGFSVHLLLGGVSMGIWGAHHVLERFIVL